MSVQVTRLEERLGTKLFVRTTRKVTLTDEGQRYFEQVLTAIEAMVDADRSIKGLAGEARGRLRIAAPFEFSQAVLGRVLARYREEFPEVQVEAELGEERRDPISDGFDVVLRTDPPERDSLVAKKLGKPTRYQILASPTYLTRHGTPKHPRELTAHTCLTMGTRSSPPTWRFAKGAAAIVHRHATANSWLFIRDLAIAGFGIGRLPDFLGVPATVEGRLVPVLDAYCPPAEQLFAVYPRSTFVPLRTSAFVSTLQRFLEAWPGCLIDGRTGSKRHDGRVAEFEWKWAIEASINDSVTHLAQANCRTPSQRRTMRGSWFAPEMWFGILRVFRHS